MKFVYFSSWGFTVYNSQLIVNDSVIVMKIEASDKVLDTYEIFEAGVVEILDSFEKENHSSV